MTSHSGWLLYGASGYTGELIAREAVQRGERPILAGRSRNKVEQLAHELDCPWSVFALDDHTALVDALQQVRAVLHCAGPFSATAAPMIQACLATRVHYLDITGEIDVFELAHSADARAQRAGVILCPGVGFDVVPTDCLAATLKAALPDATQLTLGFESHSGFSKGTAKTAIESVHRGSCMRRDGQLVHVPAGSRTRRIDFGNGERLAVGIPWGDVSTAYFTTGIPNIEVFVATSREGLKRLQRTNLARPLLRQRWVREWLKRRIDRQLVPPSATQRDNNPTFLWAEASNSSAMVKTARLRTANGYVVTVHAALGMLRHVLDSAGSFGYKTPSMVAGPDFVSALPGSTAIRVD